MLRKVVGTGTGMLLLCLSMCGCDSGGDEKSSDENNSEKTAEAESSSIGDWASDTWNGAVSTGSDSVEYTGEMFTKLYQSAKDQGVTTATSVKDWVKDDWYSQGDWQYRILSLDPGNPEAVESTLNEAGQDRWECFHVDTRGDNWTFFMKKSKRSYLSKVPLKDLANFLPVISSDGGGE